MSLLPNVIGIHHQIRIIYSMGNAGGDVKKLLNQAQLQNVILERKINENVVEKNSFTRFVCLKKYSLRL